MVSASRMNESSAVAGMPISARDRHVMASSNHTLSTKVACLTRPSRVVREGTSERRACSSVKPSRQLSSSRRCSSRNFAAEVDNLPSAEGGRTPPVEIVTTVDPADPQRAKFRTFKGRLVKGKPAAERQKLASRIAAMDADVLAVPEVEDITTLTAFAGEELNGLGYRHLVLVEGNDPRLIDVGILSRLPIGGVTSWRHAVHQPTDPQPVFSRDLVQVEILSVDRSRRLLTVFNTHLKSRA
jgi:hypothetical protein